MNSLGLQTKKPTKKQSDSSSEEDSSESDSESEENAKMKAQPAKINGKAVSFCVSRYRNLLLYEICDLSSMSRFRSC
jgi:hypothetical protein